ncbi:MAG: serine hydrolase [Bacteroidota bacterium]
MKNLSFIIAFCLIIPQLFAQKQVKEYDRLMSSLFTDSGPGGAALVVMDGKILYRNAYGMADMELVVKMTPDNIFRIGSITKQFTAAAILKLRDEGKLDLDDPITKYIEDYPMHGHKITIKHLLTHTSGIQSYTGMEEFRDIVKDDYTTEDLTNFFKYQPMRFAPGEEWNYSNSGYFLLGVIIEKASGMSYEEYINTNFFQPLGMTHSSYGSPAKIIKNRAKGYKKEEEEYFNADYISMSQPFSAGALLSTVDDLYKWYDAMMKDQVISSSSREEAQTSFVLNNGEKTGYGYGWNIGNIQGVPSIHHGGGIDGYLTYSIYLPSKNLFVGVFSNCTCNSTEDIGKRMAAVAIGEPFDREPIKLKEDVLKSYAAVYESQKDGQRIITYEDGHLYSLRTGGVKYEIWPWEKDKLFFKSTTTLQINRDSNGEIVAVTSRDDRGETVWNRTDKPLPEALVTIKVDDAITDSYVGKYELQPGFNVLIFKEEGKLYAQAPNQPKFEIAPIEENVFKFTTADVKIVFNKDESGAVTSLTIHQRGEHEAKKVE